MAFLGDIGKVFGLGTTQQFVTAATGSKVAGNIAGYAAKGISRATEGSGADIGQATAISTPSEPPREQASSGERQSFSRTSNALYQPASYSGAQMAGTSMNNAMYQQAVAPAIIGGGMAVGRAIGQNLFPYMMGGAIAAAPMILDAFGNEKPLRVTRKLKSDVKKAVEMFGVDTVADQLGVNADVVFYILTKKFRNDGAYVTKAAVRKTRQTVRKLKTICDMYDDLRPAAKRRAPTRTRAATRITNVK